MHLIFSRTWISQFQREIVNNTIILIYERVDEKNSAIVIVYSPLFRISYVLDITNTIGKLTNTYGNTENSFVSIYCGDIYRLSFSVVQSVDRRYIPRESQLE